MTTRLFGSGIRRREDPQLITGQSTYTDDIKLNGMVHAAILRSPHAHARITSIDTSSAQRSPGVLAVYTGADTDGVLNPIPCAWVVPDSDAKEVPHPALAKDIVRYVGEGVAVVVAANRYQAEDALELISVNYEPLAAVVNPEAAMQPGAPQLHEDAPNNQAFHWVARSGPVGDADTAKDAVIDAAFASAEVVVKDTIRQQRLIPNAIEPRSAVASWISSTRDLTLWSTSQNPHIVRFLCSLVTGLGENKIRVIAPEVGGGFGSKTPMYADEMIAVFCSMKLGVPVKWTATRTEGYQATIHGRDHVEYVEMSATKEGRITGIRSVVYAAMGAYLSTASTGIPTILHGLMYSGPYDIPNIKADIYGVFTTTTPVDLYRGAGRPEATFLIERLVDLLAVEVGQDPVEVRRLNLIPKFDDGHDVAIGLTYDSGDYETTMDLALKEVNYTQLRQEQAQMREHGSYMGIGVVNYCEICGLGPSQVAGAIGFRGGLWESATIRVSPTGKVAVAIGASPHGQGERTTFAQLLADELGVDVDDVEVIYGDTATTPMGWGTYGSRTTPVAGTATVLSARKIIEKAKVIAAHLLEAAEADIEFADGKFSVKGSPDQSKTFQDVALMANVAWNMPAGVEPGLEATTYFDPPNFTFPFGTHIAVVSVDPDNGNIVLQRYLATDDCGPQINPMIVEGQIHGGVVQGAGQALWEGAYYDDNGQLLTGSMLDYALPRAHLVPDIETFSTVTPSPSNPLGVKGIGETGTIASTIAIYNAVIDALRPLGVTKLDMPLTPERVWRAIHEQG